MDNKLEGQVIIIQTLNEKIDFQFTNMKYDTKKRYSEYNKMVSDMDKIKTMLNNMMSNKQHLYPDNMD